MAMFGNRKFDTQKLLVTAVGVIAVATAAVVLLRDVKNLAGSGGASEGSLIVNINTASEAELISLPGIGETRAALIIAGRPYGSVDDLDRITGIGGKTLESLRPFVTVDGETRKRE
jgi:competence protein ComEA